MQFSRHIDRPSYCCSNSNTFHTLRADGGGFAFPGTTATQCCVAFEGRALSKRRKSNPPCFMLRRINRARSPFIQWRRTSKTITKTRGVSVTLSCLGLTSFTKKTSVMFASCAFFYNCLDPCRCSHGCVFGTSGSSLLSCRLQSQSPANHGVSNC